MTTRLDCQGVEGLTPVHRWEPAPLARGTISPLLVMTPTSWG